MKPFFATLLMLFACGALLLLFTEKPSMDLARELPLDEQTQDARDYNQAVAPSPSPSPSPTTDQHIFVDEPAHEHDNVLSARDKRVADQLEKFTERTAGITKESIAAEREKIAQGLAASRDKKSVMPSSTVEKSDDGNNWQVLDYGDGVVRYWPAEEKGNSL